MHEGAALREHLHQRDGEVQEPPGVRMLNKRLLSLLPALFSVAGCDRLEESLYESMQIGVEQCVARTKSSLVDETLAQTFCIRKHQRVVANSILSGWAAYSKSLDDYSFSGQVTNKSPESARADEMAFSDLRDKISLNPTYAAIANPTDPDDLGRG